MCITITSTEDLKVEASPSRLGELKALRHHGWSGELAHSPGTINPIKQIMHAKVTQLISCKDMYLLVGFAWDSLWLHHSFWSSPDLRAGESRRPDHHKRMDLINVSVTGRQRVHLLCCPARNVQVDDSTTYVQEYELRIVPDCVQLDTSIFSIP